MSTPVLKIAKEGEDITTASDKDLVLDSGKLLPKLYLTTTLEPDIPEGDVLGEYSYTHGLGYPPVFLYYAKEYYFNNNEASIAFDPPRYIWGTFGRFAHVDNTEFRNEAAGENDSHLLLFLDPLDEPATPPEPTSVNGPRLIVGNDVANEADYQHNIDSKYQTLKVFQQDQLVCNLPAWNSTAILGGDSLRYDWFSVEHNLGYPPVYSPFSIGQTGLDIAQSYEDNIPSDFTVNDVNDLWAEKWPYEFGGSSTYLEGVWIYVDVTKLYLGYRRQNWDYENGHTFPSRTVRLNYTIFVNPITGDFNLLD